MTMLTPAHGPLHRARHPLETRSDLGAGNAAAHLATIKRFCLGALAILLGGIGVAAIMALKIAIYLPRFIQH